MRLEPLYADLRKLMEDERRDFFWSDATLSVSAYRAEEFAASERQLVGTVKNALIDAAAARDISLTLNPERPDLCFDVRVMDGQVVVALDLAGRPMHQRGYRHQAGEAPLREDVAAMLVMLCRHDSRKEALLDPMAGAGTIAIEAACMAVGRTIWCSGREPSAARFPALRELWTERAAPLFVGTEPLILTNDRDPELSQVALRNAQTAGVGPWIRARVGDFRDWRPADVLAELRSKGLEGGVIVCNPPYGHRVGAGSELGLLYRDLGAWCRRFRGFRAGMIVANPEFRDAFGMRPRISKPVRNGALKATFHLFDL
jgi:23S rRNA G2445 N2-methylase RlmL